MIIRAKTFFRTELHLIISGLTLRFSPFRPKQRYTLEKNYRADDSLSRSPTQGDTPFSLGWIILVFQSVFVFAFNYRFLF
ncbi:MAG: hypothetical protein C0397_14845 [Odoribacter sp.]|nr:hypothetical protein [Odoribacter sp.]